MAELASVAKLRERLTIARLLDRANDRLYDEGRAAALAMAAHGTRPRIERTQVLRLGAIAEQTGSVSSLLDHIKNQSGKRPEWRQDDFGRADVLGPVDRHARGRAKRRDVQFHRVRDGRQIGTTHLVECGNGTYPAPDHRRGVDGERQGGRRTLGATAGTRRTGAGRVVVGGNLMAGGSGKTPLVIALVERLRNAGWTPGVATRGYGRDDPSQALWVESNTDPAKGGDEPVLIARRTGAKVRADRDRAAAAHALGGGIREVGAGSPALRGGS